MGTLLPRDEARRLVSMEPDQLSDAELATLLRDRYTADLVPPCAVCGRELSIASAGGGRATVFACSEWEDDPAAPGRLRRKEGRGMADDHYDRSRWTQYNSGDSLVLELVRRFAAA